MKQTVSQFCRINISSLSLPLFKHENSFKQFSTYVIGSTRTIISLLIYIITIYVPAQGLRRDIMNSRRDFYLSSDFETFLRLIIDLKRVSSSRDSRITTQINNVTAQLLTMYIGNFISKLATLFRILHNTNREKIKYIRILTKQNINTQKNKVVVGIKKWSAVT